MTFDALDVPPPLLGALSARGFAAPTPVQRSVLEPSHEGRDLLVSSRTGSGKTVAFGLAMAKDLLREDGTLPPASEGPLVLVVAPTRELAVQVQAELTWLWAPLSAKVTSCVGGTDARREVRVLAGGVHVVVGTPGRLCDHLDRRSLDLSGARVVVLDEADEMLDMGFREELERILGESPAERRTLLFSATIPPPIEELARRYQRDAVRIAATDAGEAHADIEYRAHLVAPRDREHAVVNVLRHADAPRALVFCATHEAVTHLHANLVERGFSAVAMSGELTQPERTRALQALRDGRARVLVATDVAARGIDLPDVGMVIHADLPHDAQVLQHRSGRTGRAGRKGVAVLLAPRNRRGLAELLLKKAKAKPVWTPVPSADEIRAQDQARLLAELDAKVEEGAPEDLEIAKALLGKHPPEALVAALVRAHRASLPAPEELADPAALPVADRTHRPRQPLPPGRPPFPPRAGAIWFRLNVGREGNADPRWILPLVCRRGGLTKEQVGRIQLEDRETFVEVAAAAASAFEKAVAQPDQKDPRLRFERVTGGGRPRPPRPASGPRVEAPPPSPAPAGGRPPGFGGGKPRATPRPYRPPRKKGR